AAPAADAAGLARPGARRPDHGHLGGPHAARVAARADIRGCSARAAGRPPHRSRGRDAAARTTKRRPVPAARARDRRRPARRRPPLLSFLGGLGGIPAADGSNGRRTTMRKLASTVTLSLAALAGLSIASGQAAVGGGVSAQDAHYLQT